METNPLDGISRMNLVKGDILILKPATAAWFASLPPEVVADFVKAIGHEFPVIINRDGKDGVSKMSREELTRLLETLSA